MAARVGGSEARELLLLKRCAILTFSHAWAPTGGRWLRATATIGLRHTNAKFGSAAWRCAAPRPDAAPACGSHFEPFVAHLLVALELGGRALEHDAAVAHDVDPLRNVEGNGELLLNQQDGETAPGDFR